MKRRTEVVVLNGLGSKYAVHLQFNTDEELQRVIEALRPLGYRFRFPRR